VTVDIDGSGANFDAATGLAPGTFTITKATPAAAHLDVDLTGAVYDGRLHAIPAPAVASPYSGMGAVTVKYNGSATPPTDAGTYTVTVDIDGSGANFAAATGLAPGTFTIAKATPAAEHLDVDLTDAVYDGLPHAIPAPTVASPYSGMGVITVKYDGSAAVPTETGTYAVTADIDGSGANFDAVTGLALGAFTIAVPSGTDPVAASIRVWSYAGRLYIASPATSGRAYVYHVSGQLVKILPYVAGETLVQALPAGVYVVTVRGRDCKVRIH
jgi:hypothetical protein